MDSREATRNWRRVYCAASDLDVLALSVFNTLHLYRVSISDILHICNLGTTCWNLRSYPNYFENVVLQYDVI